MRDSIRQMLIGFGLVPENFQDKFGAVDDPTRALIDKNTKTGISTMARLNEQKRLGIRNISTGLSARGMRRSGSKGFGLRNNQLSYDRNLADSLSQMMGQVGGMYGQYAQNEQSRQAALMQAAMNYFTPSGGGDSGLPPNADGTAPGQENNLGMHLPAGYSLAGVPPLRIPPSTKPFKLSPTFMKPPTKKTPFIGGK
jgi:hypothetical protein